MNALTVTFFRDQRAATKREAQVTLAALVECIEKTTRLEKAKLPWLKCARFGEVRTKDGCLRHNANVLAVTGIEADYDAEQIRFDRAEGTLTEAGILAILYTSPSYTENTPRSRVLCPLSQEYPPDRRDAFMSRLNGLFGGVFSIESWTLSQSFYFGAVKRNPSHRVAMIGRDYIDLRDDLEATAVGRPQKLRSNGTEGQHPVAQPQDITDARLRGLVASILERVRRVGEGQKHQTLRDTARTLGGYLHMIC